MPSLFYDLLYRINYQLFYSLTTNYIGRKKYNGLIKTAFPKLFQLRTPWRLKKEFTIKKINK